MDTTIALISLFVSMLALGMSFIFWRRQFRPIITACVKAVKGGSVGISYSLKIINSGSIPAKNIKIQLNESEVEQSLGSGTSAEDKEKWLRSVNKSSIHILQNGDSTSCYFGSTEINNSGFWKYGAEFHVVINYEGWFGYKYTETQLLKIQDLDSFTGYMWGNA